MTEKVESPDRLDGGDRGEGTYSTTTTANNFARDRGGIQAQVFAAQAGAEDARDNETLRAALLYASFGWRVLPVEPGGKRPVAALVPRGFHDALSDPTVIRAWFEPHAGLNVGCVVPDGVVVLDVDIRNGGHETLDDLQARHGALPSTLTARTGGGGSHHWYRIPAGQRVRTRLGHGVDVKLSNGYLVMPPSRTVQGYHWLDVEDADPALIVDAPAWLLEPLAQPATPAQPSTGGGLGMTAREREHIDEALSFLDADSYAPWIEVGQALHATGDPDAFRMWCAWSQQSSKFPGEAELARRWAGFGRSRSRITIRTLFKRAMDAGWSNPMTNGEAARDDAKPDTPKRERIKPVDVELDDVDDEEQPPQKFIVKDWLPANVVTLFNAHGSAGKSQMALHLCVGLASGTSWGGIKIDRRYKVLLYSCEDAAKTIKNRLQRALRALGIKAKDIAPWLTIQDATEADNVFYDEKMQLTQAYDDLREKIEQGGYEIVVLDNASDIFAGNEISRAQVKDFMGKLKRLANIQPDGAVLLLAHVSKEHTKSGTTGQGYSGSTAWHNSARSRWEMSVDADGVRVLTVVKNNYATEGHVQRWVWNHIHHTLLPGEARSPTEMAIIHGNEERQVLIAVQAAHAKNEMVTAARSGSLTAKGVLDSTGKLPARFKKGKVGDLLDYLDGLVNKQLLEKRVVRTSGGRPNYAFFLTATGASRASSL